MLLLSNKLALCFCKCEFFFSVIYCKCQLNIDILGETDLIMIYTKSVQKCRELPSDSLETLIFKITQCFIKLHQTKRDPK